MDLTLFILILPISLCPFPSTSAFLSFNLAPKTKQNLTEKPKLKQNKAQTNNGEQSHRGSCSVAQ